MESCSRSAASPGDDDACLKTIETSREAVLLVFSSIVAAFLFLQALSSVECCRLLPASVSSSYVLLSASGLLWTVGILSQDLSFLYIHRPNSTICSAKATPIPCTFIPVSKIEAHDREDPLAVELPLLLFPPSPASRRTHASVRSHVCLMPEKPPLPRGGSTRGICAITGAPNQFSPLSSNSGVTRRNPAQALDRYPLILVRDPLKPAI